MNIFDPQISGSLSVSGSGQISGDLTVLGTLYATISGTAENAISTSHASKYTLTSSFHQFTSSYTTGAFTGSFNGDGTGLYNIPASGVTGLNLTRIAEGSSTASISQADGLRINTNTELTGSLKISNINLGVDKVILVNVTDSGGKYFIDGVRNPVLSLIKGFTYKFLFPNIGAHPFRFSTTNDGTHNGGSIYSTGVTTGSTPDYIQIEVTDNTPSTLYYFCTSHIGMGNGIGVYSDLLNVEADRQVVYVDPSRIATTGSNTFIGTETISGSLSVTGSVNITGSISLNGQAIGTGKLDEVVFNSYTSSNDTTNSLQNGRLDLLEISTSSLNTYTSSTDGRLSSIETSTGSLNTFTSSTNTRLGVIESTTSSLNTFTSSTNTRLGVIESTTSSLNNFTSSTGERLNTLETSTGSLNTYTSSTNSRLSTIETSTGSLNNFTSSTNSSLLSIHTATSSLNSYTSSNNGNINAIHTATSSLNTFSSSILGSVEVTGSNLTIKGNLLVKGTTTQIDSTTLNIGDNIISLNGTATNNAGLVVQDASGASTVSGSLLWDTSTDFWKAGKLGSEERIVLVNEYNTFSTSIDSRANSLQTTTSSLNSYTSSNNTNISSIHTATSSLNTFTSSANGRLNSLETTTGSLNTYTSSTNTRLGVIETTTGSLNTYTSSTNTRLGVIESTTSSLNSYTTSTNTRLGVIESTTGSLNSYTSSTNTRLGGIEVSTGSLNTFSSSTNSRLSSLESASSSIRSDFNTFTSSNNTVESTQNSRLNALESTTGSINSYTSSNTTNINAIHSATSSLNSYTSSNNTRLGVIESTTSSLNTYTSSTNTRLGVIESTTSSLNSYTSSNNTNISSIHTATSSLNSFTSSINTTIKNKLNSDGVISGSVQVTLSNTTGYSTFSSSLATTDAGQDNRLGSIEGKTGSYATTGSNIFIGNQTITGSLYVSQDLIIAGSSSIQHISSSVVNIADNIITVNAQNPSVRFGGLAVIDSGSSPQVSGSLLFDSVENQWLYVHQNQSSVTSALLIMGPETYNNIGGETHLTVNRLPKSVNDEHIGDSNITDTGTKVSINSNTEVTGTFIATGNISSPNITAIQVSTGSLNSFTSSILAAVELTGSNLTVKGNLLVKGTTTNVNTTTLDVDNNLINLNGTGATFAGLRVKDTTAPNQISGSLLWDATNDYWIAGQLGSEQRLIRETEFNSAVSRVGSLETSTASLNTYTSSTNTRLGVIESTTGSLNSYTSSNNTNITAIHTATSSLNSYTSSTNSRLSSIETATSSLNSYTSSNNTTNNTQNSRLTAIETTTGSLNSYTSSNTSNINAIHTATSSLNSYTSSNTTNINAIHTATSSLNSYTSSNTTNINAIHTATASLNSFTSSAGGRLTSIEGVTGSIASLNTYTGSNNTVIGTLQATTSSLNSYTSSNTTNINAIHTATSSLNSFTNSFNSAFSLSGNDVTVKGNFTVSGTTTTVNSTTVNIADNIIQLNGTGATNAGIVVRDATASTLTSGSLLWDTTNDKWIAGPLGSEDDVVLRTATQTLTNKTINASQLVDASVTNAKLANSSFNIGTTSISLGRTSSAQTLSGVSIDGTVTKTLASGVGENFLYANVGSDDYVRVRGGSDSYNTGWIEIATSDDGTEPIYVRQYTGVFATVARTATLLDGSGNTSFPGTINGLTVSSGTITSGTWNGTAIANAYLANSSFFVGTTSISLGRASASQTLTGVSIDGNAGTVTNGVYTTGDQTIGGAKTFSSNITNAATADWYMYGFGARGASSGQYGMGLASDIANRTLSFHVPNLAAYSNTGNTPKFGWYSNGSVELMTLQSATGNLVVTGTFTASNFTGTSSGTNTGDQTNITGNAGTVTNGVYTTGDQTITGQKTFPSAIANRPILGGGFISAATGDLNVDLWGISEDYYPSHATAANAWGIRWSGDTNDIQFVGGGSNRFIFDLDSGNLTIGGTVTSGTWQGSSISTTYTDAKVTSVSAGTGISVNATTGAVTVTNSGVTSIAGTSNQITASASTGGVTLSLPQNIHTGASPTFADATLTGGLTIGGSLSRGTYTSVSNYVTGADNIVLKGNSSGVSGIFFESEKDGTNINHPSDFGFIQFFPYGIGGSSGEANRLVIGVSNDADDMIVLNAPDSNGIKVRVGAGTTEYTVYHAGNIPTWNQNTTGTASNITAYTINQNVGTGNSPTFAGLALGDGIYTYSDTNRDAGAAAYYPNAWTRGFRFSFANASSTNTAGNYSGVLHLHPWDGTTSSTGDASYQLAFGSTATNGGGTPQLRLRKGIDTTWNSWYTVPLKATASFSTVSSVTVTHNFNTKDVMVMCYDSNDEMFWPSTITTALNTVTITFAANRTGRVVVIG